MSFLMVLTDSDLTEISCSKSCPDLLCSVHVLCLGKSGIHILSAVVAMDDDVSIWLLYYLPKCA